MQEGIWGKNEVLLSGRKIILYLQLLEAALRQLEKEKE